MKEWLKNILGINRYIIERRSEYDPTWRQVVGEAMTLWTARQRVRDLTNFSPSTTFRIVPARRGKENDRNANL